MLHFSINTTDSILTLEPSGPLLSSDFEAVGKALDPYLDQHGKLDGLLIHAPSSVSYTHLTLPTKRIV